jgi:hypothetical protein
MASQLPDERRWDLADIAEFHLREYFEERRPRDAGPACARFIEQFMGRLDFLDVGEANVRYAEDQIASALLSFVALGEGWRIARPTPTFPGFAMPLTHGWPIVVVYGSPINPQYALIYENILLTPWSDAVQPVASHRNLEPISESRLRDFFGDQGDSSGFWTANFVELLAFAVSELARAWQTIRMVFTPRLPRRATAGTPIAACAVAVPGDSASMGVIGTSNGRAVATTVAHMVGGNTAVSVGAHTCNVLQVDFVQDAAMFDVSHLALGSTTLRGPLVGLTPAGGVIHHFAGSVSGPGSDPVIAWDAAIPWVAPSLPIQCHVYTGCVTQTGDSGAALVSPAGRVVGFAQFSSPGAVPATLFTSPSPGLSGWVWAEAVFTTFSIT